MNNWHIFITEKYWQVAFHLYINTYKGMIANNKISNPKNKSRGLINKLVLKKLKQTIVGTNFGTRQTVASVFYLCNWVPAICHLDPLSIVYDQRCHHFLNCIWNLDRLYFFLVFKYQLMFILENVDKQNISHWQSLPRDNQH